MKYRIKWYWAGAEQTAIVTDNDGAKPVAVLYFYGDNGKADKRDYVLLHEGYSIGGGQFCQAVGLTSCEADRNDWIIDDSSLRAELRYKNHLMLDFCHETCSIKNTTLANWFIENQPMLQQWQIDLLAGSYQALNYLKASIEHE